MPQLVCPVKIGFGFSFFTLFIAGNPAVVLSGGIVRLQRYHPDEIDGQMRRCC
jgi:hypothetical protein